MERVRLHMYLVTKNKISKQRSMIRLQSTNNTYNKINKELDSLESSIDQLNKYGKSKVTVKLLHHNEQLIVKRNIQKQKMFEERSVAFESKNTELNKIKLLDRQYEYLMDQIKCTHADNKAKKETEAVESLAEFQYHTIQGQLDSLPSKGSEESIVASSNKSQVVYERVLPDHVRGKLTTTDNQTLMIDASKACDADLSCTIIGNNEQLTSILKSNRKKLSTSLVERGISLSHFSIRNMGRYDR